MIDSYRSRLNTFCIVVNVILFFINIAMGDFVFAAFILALLVFLALIRQSIEGGKNDI